MEGIFVIILNRVDFKTTAVGSSAHGGDRYLDFYGICLTLIMNTSVSSRENGADSILDLGLLEAPEKAQVHETSISTPDNTVKQVNSGRIVPESHFTSV